MAQERFQPGREESQLNPRELSIRGDRGVVSRQMADTLVAQLGYREFSPEDQKELRGILNELPDIETVFTAMLSYDSKENRRVADYERLMSALNKIHKILEENGYQDQLKQLNEFRKTMKFLMTIIEKFKIMENVREFIENYGFDEFFVYNFSEYNDDARKRRLFHLKYGTLDILDAEENTFFIRNAGEHMPIAMMRHKLGSWGAVLRSFNRIRFNNNVPSWFHPAFGFVEGGEAKDIILKALIKEMIAWEQLEKEYDRYMEQRRGNSR
jgi:hypothetical protein